MKTALKLSPSIKSAAHDPYAALRHANYRLFALGSLFSTTGDRMRKGAIGWELYDRTRSAMVVGWIGLAQFLPVFLLSLWAGRLADRVDRRRIVVVTLVLQVAAALGLVALSLRQGPLVLYFLCLAVLGMAGAFQTPASQALLPRLLPRKIFGNAITWISGGFQVSAMVGPFLAGILLGFHRGAALVYSLEALGNLIFLVCLLALDYRPGVPPSKQEGGRDSLSAGLSFVWKDKVLFGCLSLDLFAVLLGGATALMPIYAQDILKCGPAGYGALNSVPFVGAFLMAMALAHRPPMKKAGPALLWAVAGFGVFTLCFALSRNFWFSLLMLGLAGAMDAISVVVRHTLVQMRTPDSMRGRVSAVNNVFIGSSNELGEFESGTMAAWLGPVASAAAGGIGTVLVVAAITLVFPQLRKLKTLH